MWTQTSIFGIIATEYLLYCGYQCVSSSLVRSSHTGIPGRLQTVSGPDLILQEVGVPDSGLQLVEYLTQAQSCWGPGGSKQLVARLLCKRTLG